MSVRETLDKLENMVVGASHFPFTEKTLINDNDLIHYVEELRNDLPKELNRADEIMRNHDKIIREAEQEAEEIKTRAKEYAESITDENEIVKQAKEKAKTILQQTQEQEKEIMARTQAIKELSLKEYQQEMAGVYTTSVNEGTIDEAPMAYKSLDDILDVIGDTVDVIDVMKPVYNFKAAEEKHF